MKNKVCVIFTGGTIGSSVKNGTVDLDRANASLLIDTYKKNYGSKVAFDELHPVEILSENVQTEDIARMAACVKRVDVSRYDGIILTHGTDTMCFTANVFSQIFCGFPLPIVIVSASYPLDDPRSNGLTNFAAAVTFIETASAKGVFVSFANPDEPCKIHLASRLTSPAQMTGTFDSLLGLNYGTVQNGAFTHNPDPRNPSAAQLNAAEPETRDLQLCTDVVTVRSRALLDFRFYRFDAARPKAIVLELYHSGTICSRGADLNALTFIRDCLKQGITVVLSPVDSKANVYAGMQDVTDECIKAFDMSYEMTVAKVMLAIGSDVSVRQMLDENNAFEKIDM